MRKGIIMNLNIRNKMNTIYLIMIMILVVFKLVMDETIQKIMMMPRTGPMAMTWGCETCGTVVVSLT